MLSLRRETVVLLAIFIVQFCDYCVSLEIHDRGVCGVYSPGLDDKGTLPPKFPRPICCDNYEYDRDLNQCMPICSVRCMNSQCVEPNKCQCNDGHTTDPNNSYDCIPICEPKCVHGFCSAPNQCECYVGFEKAENNSVCKPTCVGCEFGQCVMPNNCSCFEGYERINSTCKPKCSTCSNRDCVAPETCRSPIENTLTERPYTPTCSPPCIKGYCPTPNQCICNKGYDLICSVICNHGYCTRPSNCTCKPKKKGAIFSF